MAASDDVRPVRWSRLLGVLIAAFLVVEAGAQAFFVNWTGKPYGSIFLYNWSPYGLVRNNPELTGNFIISRDGFREMRTYEVAKPANTFRVLLMGGSVLYSGSAPVNALPGYVPSDSTISQYLAAELKADPAFAGVNVEVINAGVNFNRIIEVSTAYLGEYIKWNPDVVIVFGSANNFSRALRAGDVDGRLTELQQRHPWHMEFDRLANEHTVAATIEVIFRQTVDASASLAIVHKALTRTLIENDPLARLAMNFKVEKRFPDTPEKPLASREEEARHFNIYASYASAIIGAARRSGQEPAFVWEYHLGDLGGVKPMSAEELSLYPAVKRPQYEIDADLRARDRWLAFMAGEGVVGVDPLPQIKQSPQTVFTDYLHYTSGGNAVVAKATHQQLRGMLTDALARSRAPRAAPAPADAQAVADPVG